MSSHGLDDTAIMNSGLIEFNWASFLYFTAHRTLKDVALHLLLRRDYVLDCIFESRVVSLFCFSFLNYNYYCR